MLHISLEKYAQNRMLTENLREFPFIFKLFSSLYYLFYWISSTIHFKSYEFLNFINIFLDNLTFYVIKNDNYKNHYSVRRLFLHYVDCSNTFETKPINQPKPTNFETNCYFARLSL